MSLQDETIKKYLSLRYIRDGQYPTTKNVATKLGIDRVRLHRIIKHNKAMYLTEYEKFLVAIDKLVKEILCQGQK